MQHEQESQNIVVFHRAGIACFPFVVTVAFHLEDAAT